MRFSIDRANLLRACHHVSGIVKGRSDVLILSNLKLVAEHGGDQGGEHGRLTVTASNMDMCMSVTVPARVEEPGEVTAPAAKMKSIADTAPEGAEISCSTGDGDRMQVRAARARFNVLTLPAADFPVFEGPRRAVAFSLHGVEAERLLSVSYAAGETDGRAYLDGVFLHIENGALAAVATNGHVFAYAEIPLPDGAAALAEGETAEGGVEHAGVNIPLPAVKVMQSLISDDRVAFDIDDNKVEIEIERGSTLIRFASKLRNENKYPAYTRALPPPGGRSVTVDANLFAAAIRRCLVAKDDKGNAMKVRLEGEIMTLSFRSRDGYEANDTLDVEWEGDPFEIGFNYRYVLDTLTGMGAKELTMSFTDPGGPSRVDVPGDEGRRNVIMPMRI
ncbi:DNA polymerase-3 subunit beta [Parvibaculum indicum]|uniref:DNA polymerase III subunit beta n=1 Tax=Parvibaculum indicum TaxID=562969 RepID=UPI001421A598|nr:DNA polymerase III subunit beta [Parvibaculum indicum]NIJ40392.1 DNA polymerase-3 subunit beta [Parvibaculum indicum]